MNVTHEKIQDLFTRYCEAKVAFNKADAAKNDKDPYPYESARSDLHAIIIRGRLNEWRARRKVLTDCRNKAERVKDDLGKTVNQGLRLYGLPVIVTYQGHPYSIRYNNSNSLPKIVSARGDDTSQIEGAY